MSKLQGLTNYQKERLYDQLADYLPVEGRDYTIEAKANGDNISLKLIPITEIGAAWITQVNKEMSGAF